MSSRAASSLGRPFGGSVASGLCVADLEEGEPRVRPRIMGSRRGRERRPILVRDRELFSRHPKCN